jgi:hypothetical protein
MLQLNSKITQHTAISFENILKSLYLILQFQNTEFIRKVRASNLYEIIGFSQFT